MVIRVAENDKIISKTQNNKFNIPEKVYLYRQLRQTGEVSNDLVIDMHDIQ